MHSAASAATYKNNSCWKESECLFVCSHIKYAIPIYLVISTETKKKKKKNKYSRFFFFASRECPFANNGNTYPMVQRHSLPTHFFGIIQYENWWKCQYHSTIVFNDGFSEHTVQITWMELWGICKGIEFIR